MWNDIREKKPDHKNWKQYLVYINDGMCIPLAGINDSWSYKLAMYCNKDGFCIGGEPTNMVTHWMDLPKEPPMVSIKKDIPQSITTSTAAMFITPEISGAVYEN